jgi:hypothetical protein
MNFPPVKYASGNCFRPNTIRLQSNGIMTTPNPESSDGVKSNLYPLEPLEFRVRGLRQIE